VAKAGGSGPRRRADLGWSLSAAGFTIKNLLEIEDSAGGRAPGIEARFGRAHLASEHLGISYMRYAPGARSPMAHSHREQEEAYIAVAGSGRVRLDDEIHEIGAWDVVRVSPATVRAFEAGPDGLVMLIVGSDRPDGGDGIVAEGPVWPGESTEP
jgi:mannose-6-phosphate isomerase-like protein (cupin superfamily)